MYIDHTTLSDLEVFSDSEGRGGLFSMVDHTESEIGRRALRQRLEVPHATAAAALRTQQAIRFFIEGSAFTLPPRGSTERVVRYLASNIEVGRTKTRLRKAIEAAWLRLRYRDLLRELRDGVSVTSAWLQSIKIGVRSLLAENPPEEIESLAREVLSAVGALPTRRGPSTLGLLQLDQVFRGDKGAAILRAIDCVGELDALRSMARATTRLGWSLPELVEGDDFGLSGEGLFHPFVEEPVPNPIELGGSQPVLFLTGPNMAGKTTYLRAAALSLLLAQAGMGVPARRLTLTPVEVLFTSLNPADNLRAGLSYFLSEVLRVRDAALHLAAGRRSFMLFDEVFKGTNIKDAHEASKEVILGFSRSKGSGFIFSSHLAELAEEFRATGRVRFRHFSGRLNAGRAQYSYLLRSGVSDQRLGMQLLNEAEIPELLDRIGN